MIGIDVQKSAGAIIYTRVSTCMQVEHGTSLGSQLEACQKKINELGMTIVAVYEDAGISGGFLALRPGMLQAIDDIKQGKADTLVVANMTRYSRDVEHQQQIKKAVRAAGGRIVFTDMQFEDTPEGDLAFNVTGAFAEYERKVFRQRSMLGIRRRVAEGVQACRTSVPFGYHIPTKADVLRGDYSADVLGKYLVVEEKATIVRNIFVDLASGKKSLSKIARDLTQHKIPAPKGGAVWTASSIRVIASNPVYKGKPAFGRTKSVTDEARADQVCERTGRLFKSPSYRLQRSENAWISLEAPPVVTKELWDLARLRMEQNQSSQGGNPTRVRMLSGRLYCTLCGGPMNAICSGKKDADSARYVCGRSRRAHAETGRHSCDKTRFKLSVVESSVIKAIHDACERPEALAAAIQEYRSTTVEAKIDIREGLRTIDAEIEELAQDEAAAVKAQIAGIRSGASPEVYASVFADIAAKRKDLEGRREVLSKNAQARSAGSKEKIKALPVEELKLQALDEVRLALGDETITGSEKRSLVASIIERVTCHQEGADIQFKPGIFGDHTLQSTQVDFVLFEP